MNVLIVEDEAVAARQLKAMLCRAGEDINVMAVLESIEATVTYLRQSPQPDLILLDIELADGQSFEIFKQVNVTSPVIFTTAYDEYARKAFEVNSVDYLLKPIEEAALRKALDKFRQLRQTYGGDTSAGTSGGLLVPIDELLRQINQHGRPNTHFRDRFLVHMGQRLLPIDVAEVAYFFTANKLTYLKTGTDKQYAIDYSLDELEQTLDPRRFYRVNRQFIVSHKSVQKVHLYFTSKLKVDLLPATDDDVIISREKSMAFRRWLGE
ncbi:response regulator transcription factor [Spirosoma sp. BT702]|uniref:Response regulator transcription factor n=1 Tax=Spirosoma profusum TaxID=2771354 RepID=A0A926XYG3_9BACT|nr:LytTR family DNA-binding domain-containing protein [Spirosoma profusum]MBD2703087.1 response regulator transcription factor [Spirosoma profusum]